MSSKPLRIVMIPARRNRITNAYTGLMTEALERTGDVVVEDISFKGILLNTYDVVHFHWPHIYAHQGSYLLAVLRSLAFLAVVWFQKLRGASIVWTVHDVRSREMGRATVERPLMASLIAAIAGLIFLSETSVHLTLQEHPELAAKSRLITYHGLYGDTYPNADRGASRIRFGLSSDAKVIGFIGDIKPYKGLDLLINAYDGASACSPVLFIAGTCSNADERAALHHRTDRLVAQGIPLKWEDKRLSEEEMTAAIAACDLIMAPYTESWNSGIVTLVLEHYRPVLCSDFPLFRELQDEEGESWVQVYDGPLTLPRIEQALATTVHSDNGDVMDDAIARFRERRDWDRIARDVVGFYRSLRQVA